MTITVTAFAWVPPVAQGLVRDLRVRWALEEAGLQYDEQLLRLGENKLEPHLRLQPFGQVPAYQEDGICIFESGAVVLHIAEHCAQLMPTDRYQRARTKTWMFAALNTVEPPVVFLNQLQRMDSPEARAIQGPVTAAIQGRLDSLANYLGDRDYLEHEFTAGDLLMTSVLRILRTTDLVRALPILQRYQERCQARPAFERALSSQMAAFEANKPS